MSAAPDGEIPTARVAMDKLAEGNGWSVETTVVEERTSHTITRYRRGRTLIEVWRIRGRIQQLDLGTRTMGSQTYGKKQALERALRIPPAPVTIPVADPPAPITDLPVVP